MPKPWFGAKSFGVGIGPRSIEGWLLTGAYVVAMVAVTPLVVGLHVPIWWVFVSFGLLTAGFLIVALLMSDGAAWRWRWGNDGSER
jgi:hypothetical protein